MTLAHADPGVIRAHHTTAVRWRRRARLIHILRIALPAAIALILAAMAATVAWRTIAGGQARTGDADAPIRLVNARFVGRDNDGRAFVITAATAVRDDEDYQRVLLDRPTLMLDEDGARPTRVTAKSGVYHEGTRKLQLQGGVRLVSDQQTFDTATSLFNTATGELSGSGPIQGVGSLGEIDAKSYAVYDKGERIVFKGGVHARIPTD
ncbi:MAG: LPS export ABC transporter periplasmic protein LptC [Phenylobacterium sp.]|uniref:LPS export ABC transporter periplasmic protein LptC n=1 Tax=Phenylobacterium sp. TaxID=1871053 RepID=UPI00391D8D1C